MKNHRQKILKNFRAESRIVGTIPKEKEISASSATTGIVEIATGVFAIHLFYVLTVPNSCYVSHDFLFHFVLRSFLWFPDLGNRFSAPGGAGQCPVPSGILPFPQTCCSPRLAWQLLLKRGLEFPSCAPCWIYRRSFKRNNTAKNPANTPAQTPYPKNCLLPRFCCVFLLVLDLWGAGA